MDAGLVLGIVRFIKNLLNSGRDMQRLIGAMQMQQVQIEKLAMRCARLEIELQDAIGRKLRQLPPPPLTFFGER
jgi:hypothetical protein